MKKNILIIEEFNSGHHFTYLKHISEYYLGLGLNVTILCNNKSNEFEHIIDKNISIVNISFYKYNKISFWYKLNREISNLTKFDYLFFPWLDSYISSYLHPWIITFLFKYEFSGIYFHPQYFRNTSLRNNAFSLKTNRLKNLFVLDEGIIENVNGYIGADKKVLHFPDFADNSEADYNNELVQQMIKNKKNKKVILLIGSLAKRKGILKLLQASEVINDGYFFVIVGKLHKDSFSKNEREYIFSLTQNNDKYFFKDTFIENENIFNAIIEQCDILYAGYENWYHSSNMLAKAAIYEKPIIVNKGYLMEEVVLRYNNGEVFDGTVNDLVNVINKMQDNYKYSNYLKNNNIQSLNILKKVIDE